jgi:hypothetical protein
MRANGIAAVHRFIGDPMAIASAIEALPLAFRS